MMRRCLRDLRIVITGASSGIGRSIALEASQRGAKLMLSARRTDRLLALQQLLAANHGEVHVVPGDVTDASVRDQLAAEVRSQWGALDVLINSAGVGAVGPFDAADPSRLRQIFEVNFFAAAELMRSLLPLLRHGKTPVIVNVGSVLSYCAVPGTAEYCASKFALRGFHEALRIELHRDGIDTLLVCPSTTASEFFESLIEDASAKGQKRVSATPAMSPNYVADRIIRALEHGRSELILPATARMLVVLQRLAPSLAEFAIARWFRQK